MKKRDLPAPRAWMAACLASCVVAGLGACAGAQAAPAKAVKWVVTCPAVKPREAARPDADAVARVADQAAAALLDAPLHAAAAPGDASSAPPPPAPPTVTNAAAAALLPPLPSLAPQDQPLSPPAAAEGAAMAAPAPAAPAPTTTAPLVPPAAAVTGNAHTVALQPASLAALAVPAPTAVAAAPLVPAPSAPAPVPSVAPAPVPLAPFAIEPQRWEVRTTDVTLAKTLSRWAQEAGYRLQWDAARNFLIGAPSSFVGGFEDAVAQALGTPGVRSSDYPLEACVYANTPPLVRVTRQGEQVRECVAVTP